ncbi:coiled-coil-helix-coiled-coil-helix domain-containing protein 2-like isoform X4 [Nasonia vitripennis]|uniref:CHCH domain-containing protein n=1 Tax=Nasonia vitripennis TaxID=7425 RepID=A0A7M7IU82_NASVI|nr:coiled-coil-helix-coiled-coil-helix domain-containing protein 2-like isoform X4 [Nasonia vitripennis]
MSSRRTGGQPSRSKSTAPRKNRPTPRPPPPPPHQQQPPKKAGDVVIIQPVPRQPGVLGTFAGTAAGVAAGTVIGDKITGRSESDSSSLAPPAGVPPSGPCQYDELQLLGCAQNEEDLRICESFRQAWLDCKRKYNLT